MMLLSYMAASVDTSASSIVGILGVGAAIAALATALIQIMELRRVQRSSEPSFAERVEQAVHALRDASKIVEDLESEIDSRRASVQRLQDQQELLKLDRHEIEAVSHLLQGDAKRENRRAIVISVGASAFFFVAGVAVTLLIS